MPFNMVTIAVAVIIGFAIVLLVRRQRLSVNHTILWLGVVSALVFFGAFPSVVDWLGHLLGVQYPPVLLVVIAICLLLVKVLTMDIERTHQETRIRLLTQKMAAYEAELAALKSNSDETGDNLATGKRSQ